MIAATPSKVKNFVESLKASPENQCFLGPDKYSPQLRDIYLMLAPGYPGGADSETPPFYSTLFEEHLKRLDVLACGGSLVFVAVKTAVGMLASLVFKKSVKPHIIRGVRNQQPYETSSLNS
ncbi:hypothetical protein V5799_013521 [Amblyomma americanum]|uniref:Uncharacterized protein n=1 Tax=Amblyomma americanum TaxID=6943 RepID=A0AAQ4E5N3_AMBAM